MPTVNKTCSSCSGRGTVWPDPNTICPWCKGTGTVQVFENDPPSLENTNSNATGGSCLLVFLMGGIIGILGLFF